MIDNAQKHSIYTNILILSSQTFKSYLNMIFVKMYHVLNCYQIGGRVVLK
jgi:hypothetical protein